MTSQTPEPAPSHPCDGTDQVGQPTCSNFVRSRRPSESGKHFCPELACQASKQRWLRAKRRLADERRAEGTEVSVTSMLIQLVATLGSGRRVTCDLCGYDQALPGWYHRAAPGVAKACLGTGQQGAGLPAGVMDAAMPDRA